jgi:hypothetical protein
VSANGVLALNYYFTTAIAAEKVTFYYWTDLQFNAVPTLTAANASGSKEMVPTGNSNQYWACIDGIAAKEIDQMIYACAVYEVDGVTYTTGVIPYSIATYCANKVTNKTEMQSLAAAMVVYGHHAKAYFSD